jgi:hypothetical protein
MFLISKNHENHLKRKIKAARPIITCTKNHGNFFGFPEENKAPSSLCGYTILLRQTH